MSRQVLFAVEFLFVAPVLEERNSAGAFRVNLEHQSICTKKKWNLIISSCVNETYNDLMKKYCGGVILQTVCDMLTIASNTLYV